MANLTPIAKALRHGQELREEEAEGDEDSDISKHLCPSGHAPIKKTMELRLKAESGFRMDGATQPAKKRSVQQKQPDENSDFQTESAIYGISLVDQEVYCQGQ